MSVFTTVADRVANLFGYTRARGDENQRRENRDGLYAINQALYDGNPYATRHNRGFLEDILKEFVGQTYTDVNRFKIHPHFLPFRAIVDTYLNVLPGTWGDGVELAATDDGTTGGKPVNPKLADPLTQIWRDSNLDTEKAKIIRWAANFGTVGVRVTATAKDGDKPARSVLSADHPSWLHNFETDDRGNVTAVCLKYTKQVNRGTLSEPDWEAVEVVEEFTKDSFSVLWDDEQQLEDAARRNTLGFCPYLIQRHRENGTPYGDWAYRGAEGPVHRINWRITRQDTSVDRHQFPKWFGAGAGEKPTTVDMGDTAMTWVKLHPDSPNPLLQAVVAQVDQAAAKDFWQDLRDLLRLMQPEMNLNDIKLMANISGEALQQVLKPTEQAVLNVRPGYHHGFVRGLQMALSAGKAVGAWDVGGDADYRAGRLAFAFRPQPALPLTPYAKAQDAAAVVAEDKARAEVAQMHMDLGASQRQVFRSAGFDETQIATMEGETALDEAEAIVDEMEAGGPAEGDDAGEDVP